jgi:chromosome segregation ATPase
MRIRQIELSGFRGSKNTITVPLGHGFTVITGRNGSGKSSICDALEYVLTRRLTRFAESEVEAGERIEDYIWWRDSSRPSNRQVKAVFELDNGSSGERVATPDRITSTFDDELFYERESHPPDPLSLLTQTMLIRDESIVKFSTDLPEADRFELFYRAIGLTDLVKIEKRANALVQYLKRETDELEGEYRKRRDRVAEIISEISEARTLAAQATPADLTSTQKRIASLTNSTPETSLRDLIAKANQALATERNRLLTLERLSTEVAQSAKWREQLQALELKRDDAKRNVDRAEMALKSAAGSSSPWLKSGFHGKEW